MKYIYIFALFVFTQLCYGATQEELQTKILNVFDGDYIFLEERVITFTNLPPVGLFVYRNPRWKYMQNDLWEFSKINNDGSYTLLLPADLNPTITPPTLYYVKTREDAHGANIQTLGKIDGTAMMWRKDVYRYTGDTVELKETFWGYEDAPHADPVTGKGVRTPPTWWDPNGVPMTSQAARLKQDEEGNTWRLVAEEVVEEDTAPASKKAILYRKDSKTGHWWKNLGK